MAGGGSNCLPLPASPFSLSAGFQRMVLLARALVKRPRLLILDEPCQGLDAAHRGLFVRAVDALIRARAATVLYVTHRPDEESPRLSGACCGSPATCASRLR